MLRVDSYSGFGTPPEDTGLEKFLRENLVEEVHCVGLAYDFCVGSTAYDASVKGFKTTVIIDATRSISEETSSEMTQKLKSVGVMIVESSQIMLWLCSLIFISEQYSF